MRRPVLGVSIAAVLAVSAFGPAQADGLHNSTKTFTDASEMSAQDWTDSKEMDRTWRAAIVRIPAGKGKSRRSTTADLPNDPSLKDRKLPTVIYMHGCSGIWPGTLRRVRFLAENGFLVIAPASFARRKYPKSCDTATHRGGLYRGTLRMRQNDAGHAIEQARRLPFVDGRNIFLIGLSQGGITAATFTARNDRQHVKARVVEGWTCNAG